MARPTERTVTLHLPEATLKLIAGGAPLMLLHDVPNSWTPEVKPGYILIFPKSSVCGMMKRRCTSMEIVRVKNLRMRPDDVEKIGAGGTKESTRLPRFRRYWREAHLDIPFHKAWAWMLGLEEIRHGWTDTQRPR